jgi:hypothetical protein
VILDQSVIRWRLATSGWRLGLAEEIVDSRIQGFNDSGILVIHDEG